jgi:hypothetical protein
MSNEFFIPLMWNLLDVWPQFLPTLSSMEEQQWKECVSLFKHLYLDISRERVVPERLQQLVQNTVQWKQGEIKLPETMVASTGIDFCKLSQRLMVEFQGSNMNDLTKFTRLLEFYCSVFLVCCNRLGWSWTYHECLVPILWPLMDKLKKKISVYPRLISLMGVIIGAIGCNSVGYDHPCIYVIRNKFNSVLLLPETRQMAPQSQQAIAYAVLNMAPKERKPENAKYFLHLVRWWDRLEPGQRASMPYLSRFFLEINP